MSYSEKDFADLRRRAENWLQGPGREAFPVAEHFDAERLARELQTYQVELELQNEDLRLAQDDLEQSQKRYANLFNFAPVGLLAIDDNGLIAEANFTLATMLGLKRSQLLGCPFSMLLHPEDQGGYYHFRKRVFVASSKQQCELRMRRKDGSIIHVLLEGTVLRELFGNSEEFRLSVTDISDRKRLEEHLAHGKDMWDRTFNAMSDCVVILDNDLQTVQANHAAREFFAQGGSQSGGFCRKLWQSNEGPCRECPGKAPNPAQLSGARTFTDDRSGRTFDVSCFPLPGIGARQPDIVQVARDVSLQRKAEEDFLQSQRLEVIGTLSGGIAHDFNNILSAILGYAEIVCSTPAVPESSKDDVRQIILAAGRAKELIQQIKKFSRKDQETKAPLDPAPIIREALKLMRASIPRTIQIREHVAETCGSVLANPIHLHQVIVNLCTNAIHAMEDEKGILTISLQTVMLPLPGSATQDERHRGEYVELKVSDTGCGIGSEVIHRIFEPYFTTKNIELGSGIGLAVVQSIISSCGGFITVESEPGNGTTFNIFLPVIQGGGAPALSFAEEAEFTGDERILVVDDEVSIVAMYTMLLERLGYTVTGATSGQKALEAVSESPDMFDLVITDQVMPSMTGLELAKQLQRVRQDIPVIVCTGWREKISRDEAGICGVDRILDKPVSKVELAKAVRELLPRQEVSKPQ